MSLRCIVIGAGMAGILSAVKLRGAGFDDVTIYEKGDTYGGTWRENTYPGLACDVPSHLYSYSFEPNPDWSRRFSPGPEIRSYFEGVAHRHGLDEITRFGEEVVSCERRDGRWQIETSRGRHDSADVVLAATGVLHHPNVPDLPGLDTFAGHAFHSARWDHDVEIDGKRVGVIGTGSTAVQITSAVVDRVEHFTLFQRTAQWIMPQPNPPYSEAQRETFRRDPSEMARRREGYAQQFTDGFANALVNADSPEMHMLEDMCRAHLEEKVTDPVLREKLRPSYRAACKRLIMSYDFYDAIQRPNAELVTEGIERVEPTGVRTTDGVLHELDVLVLATGFKVDRFVRPIRVVGNDGLDLDDAWAEGPTAYLSISVPGFPNFFMLNGPNGPVGNFSLIDVAECQIDYILQLLDLLGPDGRAGVSATAEATTQFEARRVEAARSTIWMSGCRSWYLDKRGIPATWPWTFRDFRKAMSAPDLADFEFSA
ncbi:MAG TPA: NAD(P)/FAD-dependent oxidoreductase [Acidimicrobiales bacterium]|nr:NAD(P)/FAD-dependent oxidoreductase [Acidimicrobiales bacterium]